MIITEKCFQWSLMLFEVSMVIRVQLSDHRLSNLQTKKRTEGVRDNDREQGSYTEKNLGHLKN